MSDTYGMIVSVTDTVTHADHADHGGYADLLARLADRARADGLVPPSPVEPATIQQAEAELGFPLPPLLAAAYRTIGDAQVVPARGGVAVPRVPLRPEVVIAIALGWVTFWLPVSFAVGTTSQR